MRTYSLRLLWFSFVLATVPVIAIGLISYSIASNDIENKVKESNMLILLQTQMRVEQMLKTLEKSALQFTNSPMVKRALNEKWTTDDFVKVREMSTELTNLQTSVMIHKAYFANLKQGWVVGFDVFKPLNEFGLGPLFQSYAGNPDSLFLATGPQAAVQGDEDTGGNENESTITMVQKIPLLPGQSMPRGLLVVQMLKKDVRHLLAPAKELGVHYLIDQNGDNFLGSPQDKERYGGINEAIIRRVGRTDAKAKEGAFRTTLGREEVDVAYRTSSYNGWTYVSVVSVSQMMKQTRNIQAATAAVCLLMVALVFVSAYFGSRRMYLPIRRLLELVKQTVAAVPSDPKRGDLHYIEDSIRSLWKSRTQLEQEMNVQIHHLKEFLVQKLFTGQIKEKDFASLSGQYGFPREWKRLAVMTLQIDTLQGTRYREYDRELLLFAIHNMVGELLRPEIRFAPIVIDQSQATILVGDTDSDAALQEYVYRVAETVQHEVNRYLQLQVSIGISKPFSGLSETVRAYEESLIALKGRMSLGYGIIAQYKEADNREGPDTAAYAHLKALEERIVHYLKTGDGDKWKEGFDAYLRAIFDKDAPLKEHTLFLLQLIARVTGLVQEQGIPLGTMLNGEKTIKQLLALNTKEELAEWFCANLFAPASRLLEENSEARHVSISNQILEIVHSRRHGDITLEACAELLNYHPVYLGRVFKKHVGIPFSDYVTGYKMDQAKMMLENTEMKVSEIGEKLHYKNTSAFIRTFRKALGMTPGQYRELNRK
ncbi:helix-turn-helix domain-containing protein [Paenibacillus thailandensis]|uniref:Helix-turn-helix domain-containing protein n=1 Tax=Paenibacillus thailandensis TaxID=393250 RepID=A0ABW5QSG3_9BACL